MAYQNKVIVFFILLAALLLLPAVFAKNCHKGKACGNTCININYTCHVGTSSPTQTPKPQTAPRTEPQSTPPVQTLIPAVREESCDAQANAPNLTYDPIDALLVELIQDFKPPGRIEISTTGNCKYLRFQYQPSGNAMSTLERDLKNFLLKQGVYPYNLLILGHSAEGRDIALYWNGTAVFEDVNQGPLEAALSVFGVHDLQSKAPVAESSSAPTNSSLQSHDAPNRSGIQCESTSAGASASVTCYYNGKQVLQDICTSSSSSYNASVSCYHDGVPTSETSCFVNPVDYTVSCNSNDDSK